MIQKSGTGIIGLKLRCQQDSILFWSSKGELISAYSGCWQTIVICGCRKEVPMFLLSSEGLFQFLEVTAFLGLCPPWPFSKPKGKLSPSHPHNLTLFLFFSSLTSWRSFSVVRTQVIKLCPPV